jgi:hypothetical protein
MQDGHVVELGEETGAGAADMLIRLQSSFKGTH